MSKPKKKRVIIIIIIILGRVNTDLQNDVTSGINFDLDATFKDVRAALDGTDEDSWSGAQKDVYDAADAVGTRLENSQDPTDALATLQTALGNL